MGMNMEINGKQLAIIAAIGGAAWFLLRKKSTAAESVMVATKPATMPASGASGIWGGFGVGGSIYDAMGQAQGSMQPIAAPAPAPAPAPPPAPAPAPAQVSDGFSAGPGSSTAVLTPPDPNNPWVQLANAMYSGGK